MSDRSAVAISFFTALVTSLLAGFPSPSPCHFARHSHGSMSPASTSVMSCRFYAAMSAMIPSSNVTRTSPTSGWSMPSEHDAAITALQISAIAPSSACSCRIFLMSALLSAETSAAVFTYSAASKSKWLMPKPVRSPSTRKAVRNAFAYTSVRKVGANSCIVSSVDIAFRNNIKAKGVAFVVYQLTLDAPDFYASETAHDLEAFKSRCDVIAANRWSDELTDVFAEFCTRDLFKRG